jgi:hypothetical protein
MNPPFRVQARDRHDFAIGAAESSAAVIGSQQKPVSGHNLNTLSLKNIEALRLPGRNRYRPAMPVANNQASILDLNHLDGIILLNTLYRSMKSQQLTIPKIPHFTLLSRGPVLRDISCKFSTAGKFADPLPGFPDRCGYEVNLIVGSANYQ